MGSIPGRLALVTAILCMGHVAAAQEFSGGGGSVYFGTGFPNSVEAASALADEIGVDDERGYVVAGLQGFYQGERFRLGGAFQAHAWGGVNAGEYEPHDGAAGVAAAIWGLYATYTFRHDRVLLNAGGIAGAGRCALGSTFEDGRVDVDEAVTTFFLEPLVSLGVAATTWFGVEFELATPLFLLTDDLALESTDRAPVEVKNSDLAGVTFCLKLTFGKLVAF